MRITPTPLHSDALVSKLVEALVDVWKTLGLEFVAPRAIEAPHANDAECTYPGHKRAALVAEVKGPMAETA